MKPVPRAAIEREVAALNQALSRASAGVVVSLTLTREPGADDWRHLHAANETVYGLSVEPQFALTKVAPFA